MADLRDLSIREIGAGLRSGKVTAESLTEAAIRRHDLHGQGLSAYRRWEPELARRSARAADALFRAGYDLGPFQGVPVSVKDLFGLPGWDTYAGSPRRLPKDFEVPGPVVESLLRQQCVVTGKTHTVEFALGGLGTNVHWGTPRNPWDAATHRVPGGSSSGAGVSLCEGSAHLAFGTDTGGSVRVPASMTGQVGLKVTAGRWSLAGISPLSPTLDTPGILTRSVADAALAFAVIDPEGEAQDLLARTEDFDLDGLHIGLCEDEFWDGCSPGIAEGVRAALDEVAGAGARLQDMELPEGGEVFELFRRGGIVGAEFHFILTSRLPEWRETLDPIVKARFENAGEMTATEYLGRRRFLEERGRSAAARLAEVDVLALPTVAITPPAVADVATVATYVPANLMALRNTCPANLLGLCALTLPVALDAAGMPVGLQLVAPPGEELKLLAIGRAIERALGTGRKRLGSPPMCRD